jgi:hypothetical protein
MYVLIHKNRVVVGPMSWNSGMFNGALERLKINHQLSRKEPQSFPIDIDENTKICRSEYQYPEYNRKTQYAHGPFWDFSSDVAIGTFEVKETPVELIKSTLISQIAQVRYEKEISGTQVTIQNTEVSVTTNRGNRDVFVQKFVVMQDEETANWKFTETWLTLTKADVGVIVTAITQHVQNAFDWEKAKVEEINNCSTSEELDAVVLE